MKDPKKLRKQKPDYVDDVSGSGDPDRIPVVGGDPEDPSIYDERDEPKPREEDEE